MTGGLKQDGPSPLTELGPHQAHLIGKRLKRLITDSSIAFYSCDLDPALQMAQIIGSILCIDPFVEEALCELNWGVAIDMTLEETNKLELEKTEPLTNWVLFPEAESWSMLHERITPFLERMDESVSETVLIISHGNALEDCIFWWRELSLEQHRNRTFVLAPCSITHLRVNKWQQKVVVFTNRVEHLQILSS